MSTERIDPASNFPKPYLSIRELSALTPWTEQAIRTMIAKESCVKANISFTLDEDLFLSGKRS